MVKALKCVASQDVEGDCYKDHENFKHREDDKYKRIVCETGEDLRDYISGKEAVGCPYYQDTYGCCFEDGETYWLKDVAELLEELKSYKDLEEQGLLVRLPRKVGEEVLKELSYGDTAYGGNCTYEVRMEAIKALKKQIPMKPNNVKTIFDFSGRYYTTKGNCPVCNSEGLCKTDFYCNKCGQKLDWGEENGR